jgi:alanine racemase
MLHNSEPLFLRSKIISLDSRQITEPKETAFFAIKGVHHDGHQYIEQLYKRGVSEFVVEQAAWSGYLSKKAEKWTGVDIYMVDSCINTLQNIAKKHRESFSLPIIAVTGSNGKTTIKEWLGSILAAKFKVIKNPKSFNSQIGVPLSVWNIRQEHEIGIFEAGISKPNEMQRLEEVLKPQWGILSNIGEAHGQNFGSEFEKLKEKLELFAHAKSLIFRDKNGLKQQIKTILEEINPSIEYIFWNSEDTENGIYVHRKMEKYACQLRFKKQAQTECFLDITVPFTDEASIENCCHCAILAHFLGVSQTQIQQQFRILKSVSMRLELKEGLRNNQLIDDSYNNDLDGIKLALPLLVNSHKKQKVIIFSDVLEASLTDVDLYHEIAKEIKKIEGIQLIGVGESIFKNKELFGNIHVYRSTTELLQSGILHQLHDAAILIKGARKFNFERISNALERKTHCTQLEINLNAIQHNLRYYKESIGQNTRLMGMVKAFAYGAGSIEIANILQNQGIDYLTVAYTDEGVELRKNGIYTPIMVMNPQVNEFDVLTEYGLEPEIYSFSLLKAIDEYSTTSGKNIKIHLKIDTGMKRLGFDMDQLEDLCNELQQMPQLWIVSILSHLVASESERHYRFTERQIRLFQKAGKTISNALGYSPIMHIANSAAIQHHPKSRFDMVRLGISLYGISNKEEEKRALEPVLKLKTYISQIKTVKKNETIGYGRRGKLNKEGKIATLALGYADGYSRKLGMGKGIFEINGELCPTVGAICMDMCMVDITNLPHVKEGDTAIAFGGKVQISELAKSAETIAYEIMTGISDRVKRVYVRE